MTETETDAQALRISKEPEAATPLRHPKRSRCTCRCCAIVTVLVFLLLFIIGLILALTVFKQKDPKITIESATVQGVAPKVNLPALNIDINITLDLNISVYNPNHASFKHGPGTTLLLYKGTQVGNADIAPGNIPSSGSSLVNVRLVFQADELAGKISSLLTDVLAGQIVFETKTRIPGRVTILKIIKKHATALSDCQTTITIPDFNVTQQVCKNKTKL